MALKQPCVPRSSTLFGDFWKSWEFLRHAWWNLKTPNTELALVLAVSLQDMHTEVKGEAHTHICTRVHSGEASTFAAAKRQTRSRCLLTDEWINKMGDTLHTHNAILFNLKKDANPDICYNTDETGDQCQVKWTRCKGTNTAQTHLYEDLKQLHRGRKQGGGFGGWGGTNGEWVQWGHSWQDEQVLESTVAMVTQQCECMECFSTVHRKMRKMVNFMSIL